MNDIIIPEILDIKQMDYFPIKRFFLLLFSHPEILPIINDFNSALARLGFKMDSDKFYEKVLTSCELRNILRVLGNKISEKVNPNQFMARYHDFELSKAQYKVLEMTQMIHRNCTTIDKLLNEYSSERGYGYGHNQQVYNDENFEKNLKIVSKSKRAKELQFKEYLDQLLYLSNLKFDISIKEDHEQKYIQTT